MQIHLAATQQLQSSSSTRSKRLRASWTQSQTASPPSAPGRCCGAACVPSPLHGAHLSAGPPALGGSGPPPGHLSGSPAHESVWTPGPTASPRGGAWVWVASQRNIWKAHVDILSCLSWFQTLRDCSSVSWLSRRVSITLYLPSRVSSSLWRLLFSLMVVSSSLRTPDKACSSSWYTLKNKGKKKNQRKVTAFSESGYHCYIT